MKIFGFLTKSESRFVNITCNIILGSIVLIVFALSFFAPISVDVVSNNNGAIYCGDKNKNNISLMINVYWGTEYLDDMLKVLKNNEVKTTFFVGGCWVAKNNEKLLKIVEDGHEIGNHGYNHKDHDKISSVLSCDEIEKTSDLVRSLTGKKTNLFAPPSGSINSRVVNDASSLDHKTIMWSKDTIDWRDKDSSLVFNRATQNIQNGYLILMHPTKHTLEALDKIIKNLKSQNFNLTTVSECIGGLVWFKNQVLLREKLFYLIRVKNKKSLLNHFWKQKYLV